MPSALRCDLPRLSAWICARNWKPDFHLRYRMPRRWGEALARLIAPEAPEGFDHRPRRYAVAGIVGEEGPEAIRWDLAAHSQLHGLYQQVLQALAAQGVLIGVARRGDPAVVERAFARGPIC